MTEVDATLSLGGFRPKYFNNNADQANLEVLECELNWRGIGAEIIAVENLEVARNVDLLLIGDASLAVMSEFMDELDALVDVISHRTEESKPTLIIGSSYEYLAGKLPGTTAGGRKQRLSHYVLEAVDGEMLLGYVNTESDLPLLVTDRTLLATLAFGPVLAKNRWLLERVLTQLGCSEKLDSKIETELVSRLDEVRKINF